MSNVAMNCAWTAADAPTDPGPMFVLVVLADHASDHDGEDFRAFPSVERIVKFTKFSRSAVERHLQTLVRLGWISRRRRVRPDGRKGVYDYEMHRDADRRMALRDARAAMSAAGEKPSGEATDGEWSTGQGAQDQAEPCSDLQHGPCVNLDPTMRQFGAEPCGNSPHHEPLVEPSEEPSQGARAPAGAGFDEVAALWPDSGLKRTRWPKAREAWAGACQAETPERLVAAARACAEDPDMAKGSYGWPALHNWLADERWRNWLPGARRADPVAEAMRTAFVGPAEVMAVLGDPLFAKWLPGAVWREADRTVLTMTGIAADELNRGVGPATLARLNIKIQRAAKAA